MIQISSRLQSRALIFAPHGRDATVAADLLREAGMPSDICTGLDGLTDGLDDNTSFALVTEEALLSADLRPIAAWLKGQAPWSDLPFIILTRRGGGLERNPDAARLSEVLGNVTFLERPFHPTTFTSVARSALKGRQRQYEARARIEELREGEARLRTALVAGRLGSWDLDLSTWALSTSATCKAVFGRGPNDAFSYQDLMASIHPDDRQRVEGAVRDSIRLGQDYAIEYRVLWPDGSLHWGELRARIVRDKKGDRRRLVGVSSDITDRKLAEENMQKLNDSLEERVAVRTRELNQAHEAVLAEIRQREKMEEQLRQGQKLEMIGQLTGGVAHDFNNLLMAVIGNLDLLRKHTPDDPRIRRLIDGATQGARRGATLTQRLLAFARKQDLKVEPRSLAQLVDGMRDLLTRSVGQGIDLDVQLGDGLPLSAMDVNQVELALLNLVINARDAMPQGGTISINVDRAFEGDAKDLSPGEYVRLVVTDTGHGMDAVTLEKATEPFFSTKELGKGTGLGLSMVHGLAVQLNGALRLSSTPGIGTRAELWLPATHETATVAEDPMTIDDADDAPAPQATILMVDDDALIAMSTVDMLEDLGHQVIEANSGAEALRILEKGTVIDLMITDFSMPQMTGAELAAAARKLVPELPILLATGYAELPSDSDLDLPRLAKPYHQSQLAAEIAKILRPRGSANAA